MNDAPPRFEDEYPEEAQVLMQLCKHKKLREYVQWQEAKYPRKERFYSHLNDMAISMLMWKNDMFGTMDGKEKKWAGYERSTPKIGRNEPCPCGSGKKFKKCCIMKE